MAARIYLFVLIFSLDVLAYDETELQPFVTDYCTAYAEGTSSNPNQWKHCCVEHDLYFWAGGSMQDRKLADINLRDCVAETGAIVQSQLIYAAVTIGGQSPIRFKTKQWGHAWPGRVRYQSLTEKETAAAIHYIDEIHHSDISNRLKDTFKLNLHSRLDRP